MHKIFFFVLIFFSCFVLNAQFKLTLRVKNLPSYHNSSEPIFIAGSFNNWNPGQKEAQMQKEGNVYSITLVAPRGRHEYKLTRGSWEKVESGANGFPTENRSVEIMGDTTLEISIQHWADHFPKQAKKSTAGKNVKIISTSFFIPQLNRYRRIWIYLPQSYSTSLKKYPVLYMHDGQNVFEDSTSGFGEWGVDEALDTLGTETKECIVVAIDNGGDKRLNEYSPYDMQRFGKGEGDAYVDFLVKTLRPYINKNYRTKKCGKHNYVAGSSMGGLISFYAILKYPKKFGGAGVFSPAFWIVPQLKEVVASKAKKIKGRIYFFGGQLEGETMVPDMLGVFELMNKYSKAKMTSVVRAEGKHNEATWREEFPLFYRWVLNR